MIKRVDILSIDKNQIVKLNEKGPDVYSFYVNLSVNPSPEWKNCFRNEWEKQQNNLMIPEVLSTSARIQILFKLGEKLQTYINELIIVVDKCNDFVWQCDVEKAKRIAEMKKKEADKLKNIEDLKKELQAVTLN
ncbi:hypothetical protein EHE19_017865 [Ruminiclostridium herbifermentans]|uniref:Uncharacterized protein n=1 Tax=Ruminiclostridium herbifermentans TaxID=2488810 RepID=A0A4U7JHY1_9FIRM|nr:hypothetical protein [Ruminiclostridium herbifermentans]QNU66686.1 hypothetical protein EHE19_017865 [Ruminiclostridium herbifermentans]